MKCPECNHEIYFSDGWYTHKGNHLSERNVEMPDLMRFARVACEMGGVMLDESRFRDGFSAGNYTEAYGPGTFRDNADSAYDLGKSYYYGFVLGWFATYEPHEISPEDSNNGYWEAFCEAYPYAQKLGLLD